jgi:hypothetical protein
MDPDCTYTEACAAGLRVTAEGLVYALVRLEVPRHVGGSTAHTAAVERGVAVRADALRIEAPVATAAGEPCWIEANGLSFRGRLVGTTPGLWTTARTYTAEAEGLLAGGAGCPSLRMADLAAALPLRVGTASSALELRVGDRVPLAALRLSRGPDLQLALTVTAAGPYAVEVVDGRRAEVRQTAQGTLTLEVAP